MTDTETRLRSLEDDRLLMLVRMDSFATKADLAGLENGLIKWMVGVCLTILLFVVGFGLTLISIGLMILSKLPPGAAPTPVS
jgi:hypothetical protein